MIANMCPVLFRLGPITIYSYGTMMALAFLAAGYLTSKEMDRKGLPGEVASSMVVWAAIAGIVCSRIWAILEDFSGFIRDPISMVFTGAGFVWYGGLIGGTLAVTLVIRRHQLPWLRVVDCVAPALALAHGIGRLGCHFAGDGCWGVVTDLPWAVAYPNAFVGWDYPPGVGVHPTPIYETLAYTAVFSLLWAIRKRGYPDGTLFWLYLVLGPIARFGIEFVRMNPVAILGLTQPQLVSLTLIAIGIWRLCVTMPKRSSPSTSQQ